MAPKSSMFGISPLLDDLRRCWSGEYSRRVSGLIASSDERFVAASNSYKR